MVIFGEIFEISEDIFRELFEIFWEQFLDFLIIFGALSRAVRAITVVRADRVARAVRVHSVCFIRNIIIFGIGLSHIFS